MRKPVLRLPLLREAYSSVVRFLRQLALIFVLLLSSAAPLMACMQADAQMSASERSCCQMMRNHCGDMQMPVSHGCCHRTLHGAGQTALHAKSVAPPPLTTIVVNLPASALLMPGSVSSKRVERGQYSPPKSPPSSVLILRL